MSRAWITTLPDGRTNYRMHQSWLQDTDLCLERARLGLVGDEEFARLDGPSDATSSGTGMHAGIEACILHKKETGELLELERVQDIGQEAFSAELAKSDAKLFWKKRKERGARNYIDRAIALWYDEIEWKLTPWHVELSFGPYVLYEDDKIRIELGGAIDYVDRRYGIMDWKTGSPHGWVGKEWEKQRWALQPTVYTWAFHQWLLENEPELADAPIFRRFTFVVMLDNGSIMKLPVQRDEGDWAWLQRKVLAVVRHIEAAGLEGPWPMNDQHALCSPKWCPAWEQCKGTAVNPAWPTTAKP